MTTTPAVLSSVGLLFFSSMLVADPADVTLLMQQDLADLKNKEALVLTVEYAPGASSTAHRHDAHTFVYVLEGSVIMQVAGGDPVELKAGQAFYESPKDVHVVSKNASDSQAAKFVVFSLKEKGVPV
ncbi:MAG: cupin domain-containing protein, partial [Proteobacteria bacterium]|nr:cupin domain-containing protein [Pseudomonadota bacterium]